MGTIKKIRNVHLFKTLLRHMFSIQFWKPFLILETFCQKFNFFVFGGAHLYINMCHIPPNKIFEKSHNLEFLTNGPEAKKRKF